MTIDALTRLADDLADATKDYVGKVILKVVDRLTALEERVANIKDGAQGLTGATGSQGEKGEKGDPGERGDKGDTGEVGPKGDPGERGADGAVGPVGPVGPQGHAGKDADPVAVAALLVPELKAHIDGLVAAEVAKAVAQIPVAKDGAPGRDGVGIVGALINRDGELVLTWSDGSVKSVGPVVGATGAPGRDGKDGTNGRDGFGLEDFSFDYDGERTFSAVFSRGEVFKSHQHVVPFPLYRGVWQPEQAYERGDEVTYGGSQWHAMGPSKGIRPGEASDASRVWRLAVKKGNDGKQGPPGPPGKYERGGK